MGVPPHQPQPFQQNPRPSQTITSQQMRPSQPNPGSMQPVPPQQMQPSQQIPRPMQPVPPQQMQPSPQIPRPMQPVPPQQMQPSPQIPRPFPMTQSQQAPQSQLNKQRFPSTRPGFPPAPSQRTTLTSSTVAPPTRQPNSEAFRLASEFRHHHMSQFANVESRIQPTQNTTNVRIFIYSCILKLFFISDCSKSCPTSIQQPTIVAKFKHRQCKKLKYFLYFFKL